MTDAFAPPGKNVPAPVESEPTAPLVAPTVSTSESPRAELAKVAESSTPSDEHFKFADTTHDYVREYIRNADQKASVITQNRPYKITSKPAI